MDTYVLLIIGHIIGAVLGVGGATMIEANLKIALKTGKMAPEARPFMGAAVFVTRIGMALTLITGIGFIVLYIMNGTLYKLEDGMFWAKMVTVVIIYINAYLLHKRFIGLYWGSALSFVSWWGALLVGLFMTNNVKVYPQDPVVSFIILMALYSAAIVGGAWILHRVREMAKVAPAAGTGVPVPAAAPAPTATHMPFVQTADEALGRVKQQDSSGEKK